MRWVRGGQPFQQVQTQIDPPQQDDWYPRYQGYPVVLVVRGKRVIVWAYD